MALQSTTPVSKAQKRAARLLGVGVRATYTEMAEAFEAAGIARDGLPTNHDWRSAAKLSDDELVTLLRGEAADRDDAAINRVVDR
jgi:hypothetical protein